MSRTAHKLISASGGKAYEIEQSIAIDRGNGAYMHRTPSTAGNRKTWTWSGWIKRANVTQDASDSHGIFGAHNDVGASGGWTVIQLYQDMLLFNLWGSNIKRSWVRIHDVSAWYHFVIAIDTTQSTATDRAKMYINGELQTLFDGQADLTQDTDYGVNNTIQHRLGDVNYSSGTYNNPCLMAEVHFIDGLQKAASEFGERDSATGAWVPIEYKGGNYGTNGFYLKFEEGAQGTDSSGQGNNYTAVNFDSYDTNTDTPTNNYAAWNHNDTNRSTGAISQGGVKIVTSNHTDTGMTFKIPETGKWYYEIYMALHGNGYTGIQRTRYTGNTGTWDTGALAIRVDTGQKYSYYSGGWQSDSYGSAFADDDVINVAIDCDNGKLYWGKNGTWFNSGNPATGANAAFTSWDPSYTGNSEAGWKPFAYGPGSPNEINWTLNMGARKTANGGYTAGNNADANGIGNFKYTVPSGFLALCSKNLPTPTIKKSTEHFNTVLYTGDGSADSITGVGFQPDLIWVKARNAVTNHKVWDAIRGVSKSLRPNNDAAESDDSSENLTSFDSDGFTIKDPDYIVNSRTVVAWNWKAGGAGSSNTDGQETSTVSANPTAGFSIVKWTAGAAGPRTVGHGLGKKPQIVIHKRLDAAESWYVYTDIFDGSADAINLNSTNGFYNWNNGVVPTSSLFTHTASNSTTNIAYCFAPIEGYSQFGTYEANNSWQDGPFISCSFRPHLVIIKHIDTNDESWWMLDTTRDPQHNGLNKVLYANLTSVEGTTGGLTITANGFKPWANNGGLNYQNTYMYMAFAEFPSKYANAGVQ